MDNMLRSHWKYAMAHLDEVVIHPHSWSEHLKWVSRVIQALHQVGFTANPSKSHVSLSEANYLGYTITRDVLQPQHKKIEAERHWPCLGSKKQVRAFLGLTGY
ncbi:hypothetical protein AAFF_G00354640 [Aldrovandia affinis]|uniref:ribonuclease H n=1 Tax=Aldrovandia affinis TaxID=143900 RepID=A0AAD7SII3_9TELE|nr:hypothetical protein AAFF_G00354640 [Aldrovandia affinis]